MIASKLAEILMQYPDLEVNVAMYESLNGEWLHDTAEVVSISPDNKKIIISDFPVWHEIGRCIYEDE